MPSHFVYIIETPGPGTYQAQSDFGNYKQLFYRSDAKKERRNFGIITSDWNYSSLSPNKYDSDVSLESPMLAKPGTRPVSQLEKLNGTMRAQRLMKLVPSQEINSESGNAQTIPKRVNTVNQFHQTGRLRNIKLINPAQNIKLAKQGSESLSQTKDLMYLATNDVQSGDYQ